MTPKESKVSREQARRIKEAPCPLLNQVCLMCPLMDCIDEFGNYETDIYNGKMILKKPQQDELNKAVRDIERMMKTDE